MFVYSIIPRAIRARLKIRILERHNDTKIEMKILLGESAQIMRNQKQE